MAFNISVYVPGSGLGGLGGLGLCGLGLGGLEKVKYMVQLFASDGILIYVVLKHFCKCSLFFFIPKNFIRIL